MAARSSDAYLNVTSKAPHTIKITVPYQSVNAQNSGTAQQTITLYQLGPRQTVTGITQNFTTAFAGPGLVVTAPTVNQAGGSVTATFSATQGTLNALTAGSIDFEITTVVQP
jgi:hypothetical protein